MGKYRETRNIEASLIDFIKDKLQEDNWQNINITKSFQQAYRLPLPVLCVRVQDTDSRRREIGSNKLMIFYTVIIDIFGKDDGNKLDLSDWIKSVIIDGFPYFEYTTAMDSSGNYYVSDKVLNGKVEIAEIISDRNLTFNVNVDKYDKHRRQIYFRVYIQEKL